MTSPAGTERCSRRDSVGRSEHALAQTPLRVAAFPWSFEEGGRDLVHVDEREHEQNKGKDDPDQGTEDFGAGFGMGLDRHIGRCVVPVILVIHGTPLSIQSEVSQAAAGERRYF